MNQIVLPLLPNLISSLFDEPELLNQLHDAIAAVFRNISIDAYNETTDIDTAMAAILLAQKFVRKSELRERILQDIHQLTENKKYSTCVFCGSSDISDSSMLHIAMHGNVSRREGTYQTSTIKVPRCNNCAENSKNSENKGCFGAIACIVIGLVIGVIVWGPSGWFGGAFIGAIIGFVFNKITEQSSPLVLNSDKISKYPAIAELRAKGWAFGVKPPQ
jgi:hypothetical protein